MTNNLEISGMPEFVPNNLEISVVPEFVPGLRPSPSEGAWGYLILPDGASSVATRAY